MATISCHSNQSFHLTGIKNQRTSEPVNAHLTPGPGIYFNAFIHVYSPRAGVDNSLGTNVGEQKALITLLQVLKQSL